MHRFGCASWSRSSGWIGSNRERTWRPYHASSDRPRRIGDIRASPSRLVQAIAIIYGRDPNSEQVRTMVLMCLHGNGAKEEGGKSRWRQDRQERYRRKSRRVLIEVNYKVGVMFPTKAGQAGVVNLAKVVPVVGAVVRGSMYGSACLATGRVAKRVFREVSYVTSET